MLSRLEPARDGLAGQFFDLAADPVVDRLQDSDPQVVPGVAGQHGREVGRVELRSRLGPLRLLDPGDRHGLVPGQILSRKQELEVEPPDRDRLGIDAQVLVLELLGDHVVAHSVGRARRRRRWR